MSAKKFWLKYEKKEKEYEEIKKHNKTFNFESIESYMDSKEINKKYIDDPRDHFGNIFRSWYDFLQIDTSNFIQDKNEWITFCKNNNVKSLDNYYNLCKIHNNLPRMPNEFYNNFTNMGNELNWYTRRRY